MSRIIVKNLPKHATETRVREHFGARGDVTDVKLIHTPEGAFRRFGFVGFKSEQDAKEAVRYFNGTFVDTSRIEVALAKSFDDSDLPRAWSKYSRGSSAYETRAARTAAEQAAVRAAEAERAAKEARAAEARERAEAEASRTKRLLAALYGETDDPKLREYLAVMQPRSQTKIWANDDVVGVEKSSRKSKKPAVKAKVETVGARRPGGEGVLLTRTHMTFDDDDDGYDNVELETKGARATADVEMADAEGGAESLDYVEEDASEPAAKAPLAKAPAAKAQTAKAQTAKAQTAKAQTAQGKAAAANKVDSTTKGVSKGARPAKVYPALGEGDEAISESGRLFVRNIAYTCTEDDLAALFKPFGPLSEVHIPVDRETKRATGIAFVTFMMPEHAVRAYKALDAKIFQGRLLHILPARAQSDGKDKSDDAGAEGAGSAFKRGKEKKQRAAAGSDHNWNTLFIRQDTVVAAMADKYGVGKADILDAESDGAAVRVALGETHIIAETRRFLESHGVSLDAFGGRAAGRSNTVLIVKNIPHDTSADDLRALFGQHGTLGRVVVPPTRACALVEYLEPSEARAGLRHLAYTKFKSVPLYLEWAPDGAFSSPPPAAAEAADAAAEEPEDAEVESKTLFVKNLSFATTDDGLRAAFEGKVGSVRSATVAKKKDPKRPGATLSMGFGFVEFHKREDALRALKVMQKFALDGHALQLKMSSRTGTAEAAPSKSAPAETKAKSTKLLVRNVPFEASRKEMKELFGTFGQLKSLRMPKKFDGTHRGFAFVEYVTKQEALHAFQSLSATHLYGRHLVIEWAKDESSIEALREKTQKRFREDNIRTFAPRSNKRIVLEEGATKDTRADSDDDSEDMEVDAEY